MVEDRFQRKIFTKHGTLNPKINLVAFTQEGLDLLEHILDPWFSKKDGRSHFDGPFGFMSCMYYVLVDDFPYLVKNQSFVSQDGRTLTTEIVCPRERQIPAVLSSAYKQFYTNE